MTGTATKEFPMRAPWQDVATKINPDENLKTNIKRAGLGKELAPMKSWYGDLDGEHYQDEKRVVWAYKNEPERIIARSGPSWVPFQNRDAIIAMDEWCRTAGITMSDIGQMNGGKTIFAVADLNTQIGPANDKTARYCVLTTNHVVGMCNTVSELSLRLVCLNGMVRTSTNGLYRQTHRNPFDVDTAKHTVANILEHSAMEERIMRKRTKPPTC
jgi:Domain of unknown function (DUF932)